MSKHVLQDAPSLAPTRKVTAATFAAALVTVALYVAGRFGYTIPVEVASAVQVVVSFAGGYLFRERV